MARKQPIPPASSNADMPFPLSGMDLSMGYNQQRPGTTPTGQNVRSHDVLASRMRGGMRPGLAKYVTTQPNGSGLIQDLNVVVGVGYNSPGSLASIAYVQKTSLVTGSSPTETCTFGSAVTAGNTILVIVTSGDGAGNNGAFATSVTDNKGNTYSLAVQHEADGDGSDLGGGSGTKSYVSIYYSANVVGGSSFAVTSHYAGAPGSGILALEVSGPAATPGDQTHTGGGTTAPASTGSATTTTAVEIAIAATQVMIGVNESQTVSPAGSGWTNLANSTGSRPVSFEYKILGVTGAVSASWATFSSAGHGWTAALATFKAATVAVQSSQSGRLVTLCAVEAGDVYVIPSGGSSWTAAVNSTGGKLVTTGLVRSTSANQKLWFADGVHYLYYDPASNSVLAWTAAYGSLPLGSDNGTPRLICLWRGRIVLSGLVKDAQNWFMSAVNDPTNWDYAPTPTVSTQAVAGNASPLGTVGDVVTTLIPYTDDILVIGGDHTIWMMQGDPMAGGQIDLVSDTIGMAWGQPWCKGPDGVLYFFSNKMGVYQMTPGQPPVRMSQQIEQSLLSIDTGLYGIRLLWDDRWQGLHVFVSLVASSAATTHFFWEQRSGAWWSDVFTTANMNPLCCTTFDGNTASDRHALIGSWDGYVRALTPSATDDDGTAISSSVILGPLLTRDFDDVLWTDFTALLGVGSGTVSYQVYVGTTAEIALSNSPVASGTLSAGRNPAQFVRRAGHAIWVKFTATSAWGFEGLRARLQGQGKVRQRRTT